MMSNLVARCIHSSSFRKASGGGRGGGCFFFAEYAHILIVKLVPERSRSKACESTTPEVVLDSLGLLLACDRPRSSLKPFFASCRSCA